MTVATKPFASVVGENSNNGERTWNTNNGTNYVGLDHEYYKGKGILVFSLETHELV